MILAPAPDGQALLARKRFTFCNRRLVCQAGDRVIIYCCGTEIHATVENVQPTGREDGQVNITVVDPQME